MSCGITVCDLKKNYRHVEAVRGVSFEIGHGQVLGLIGPSGCGKSTVAKALAGLTKPDGGEATVRGRLGFASQDPYSSLCPGMRVRDIVAEPLIFRRERVGHEEAVREAFSQVRLDFDKLSNRLPHELSGGERQRVAIARALIAAGGVLILDEPASMLDYDTKLEIADVLRDLVKNFDHAVLLISHDIGFVRDIATHIAVMRDGLIVEAGGADEVFRNPQRRLTKTLLSVSLDLGGYLSGDTAPTKRIGGIFMKVILLLFLSIFMLAACGAGDSEPYILEPVRITAQQAEEMIADGGVIILDVRTQDEFNSGHIEDAVLLPLDQLREQIEAVAPDLHQTILIYCRSGNRSATAARELIDLGYTSVYDFGGIIDWPGKIVVPSPVT